MQHNYSSTFVLHTYDTLEAGLEAVRAGEVWGVANIGANFTYGLYEKFFKCSAATIAGNDSIVALCTDVCVCVCALCQCRGHY